MSDIVLKVLAYSSLVFVLSWVIARFTEIDEDVAFAMAIAWPLTILFLVVCVVMIIPVILIKFTFSLGRDRQK
jgi:hypothetical protein